MAPTVRAEKRIDSTPDPGAVACPRSTGASDQLLATSAVGALAGAASTPVADPATTAVAKAPTVSDR